MSPAAPLLILLPLGAAAAAWVLGPRWIRLLSWGVAAGTLAAGLSLAEDVQGSGPRRYPVGGWGAPLGIDLYADGLGVLMVLLTTVVLSFAGASALASRAGQDRDGVAGPLWFLLWTSLNGLFLSGDLFNLYVLLELLGLCAVALVTLGGRRPALVAGMRYLLAALLGSLAYLMGVALVYVRHGTVDLALLGPALEPGLLTSVAFAFLAAGLAAKTALFPMHFWLPPAHSSAAAPVSAVLSALVVKASWFLLVRLWFGGFSAAVSPVAAQVLGALGAVAILWGSLQALRQRRLKLLIAHSTVAQIGYLFLLFPLSVAASGAGRTEAWIGTVYQALSHALGKSALFLASGVVLTVRGRDELEALPGLVRQTPWTAFTLALAGFTVIGLPPGGGFVSKWMLLKGTLASGEWWWLLALVPGSLLGAAYVFLMLRHLMEDAGPDEPVQRSPAAGTQPLAFVLALLAIVAGFRLEEPLALLRAGAP